MKKKNWAAIALLMATAMTVGCSSDSDEDVLKPYPIDPAPSGLTRAEQEMVGSSNDFAFNLFREARDEKRSQILSPISITYALGMLNNGAAGETQQEINKVLGFSETGAEGINTFCAKMLRRAGTLDEKTKVMIADNIYMNKGFELLPAFKETVKTYYDADAETRDFADGKTRDVINQWGSDHTMGMIKEVLTEDEFDPTAVSYLLNAIYFKGTWQYQFDKNQTLEENFEHPGFTKEQIVKPMMHQSAELDYMQTDDFQALRLPYGNGAWNMTVLLPIAKSNEVQTGEDINKVLKSLNSASWQKIQQQMEPYKVVVALPRLETDTDIKLVPLMGNLGMKKAFTGAAEFPYFCNTPTYIGLMKQVAKIKLDEEGTEAAAVTVIGMKNSMGGSSDEKSAVFYANHPFLYVISEKESGAIFFIGQYTGYK